MTNLHMLYILELSTLRITTLADFSFGQPIPRLHFKIYSFQDFKRTHLANRSITNRSWHSVGYWKV